MSHTCFVEGKFTQVSEFGGGHQAPTGFLDVLFVRLCLELTVSGSVGPPAWHWRVSGRGLALLVPHLWADPRCPSPLGAFKFRLSPAAHPQGSEGGTVLPDPAQDPDPNRGAVRSPWPRNAGQKDRRCESVPCGFPMASRQCCGHGQGCTGDRWAPLGRPAGSLLG